MALDPINQFQTAPGPEPSRRFAADNVRSRTYASIAGAPTLPLRTPLKAQAGNTGFVEPWTDGAEVVGFVWPHPVATSATGQTIGAMALDGQLNGQDIPVPAGQTQAALITALKSIELRKLGWRVEGIGALV